MKSFIFVFIMGILMLSCSQKNWEQTSEGVIIYPKQKTDQQAQTVKIVPVHDEIIKVSASATKGFSTQASLIVLPHQNTVPFQVEEDGDQLLISTAKTTVKVSIQTGEVQFLDENKELLLQEKENGGKQLVPVEVDGEKAYATRQIFETAADEALYGLGQHQADEMNYKGKNEELFQYNTKVSVPFIVSTKNYGLLWDNYSLSRFGDPRPYEQINQFKLYDANGNEGGLTATYIDNTEENHVFTTRKEATIDYENLETITKFPEGFDFNQAQIVWEGEIEPEESGLFRFLLYYAGYTKIWINGKLMASKWRTAWNPSVAKFQYDMKAGEKYHLKLDWIPDGGVSYIGLKALSPVAPELQDDISFYSEMGDQIDYYFMKGNNIDEVIGHYRSLTGKAQVMPKWAMGFWQSRERYKTQNELESTLKEFRKRKIPIDNIVQDWSYWEVDQWGSHEFDKKRFPDAQGMVDMVHENNARLLISVWPKFYLGTEHYNEFDKNGWMYKQAINDSIRDWIYPGYIGSFYDAYNADARQLFWEQIDEHLYEMGIDAWWLDATEPDILSNASIEYRKKLMNPTALGSSTQYFNAFALMNAKGIYEGQREKNPKDRVFILTRSGFAGMQRYGTTTWSGDIGTTWEDMKAQISAGINFSMSGLPYWTMDIGGFCVQKKFERATEGSEEMAEWRELNTRWYQFGAFAPLFRVHGQFPYREIYNIAPENHPAYQSMLYYNKLRYRLMPYIYSLTGAVYHDDYTLMRGLAMDFASDPAVLNIGDQFMFGPSLLVCPVYKYKATKRAVYFPKNTGWYNLYSGAFVEGGQQLDVKAPYERMPLFVREGSIIPVGPEIQYTDQKKDAPIDIYVYSGKDASFKMYEDEGTTYAYESGEFCTINFSYSEKDNTLKIGKREGSYPEMIKSRVFRIIKVSPENPVAMLKQANQQKTVNYTGEEIMVSL
ncbi:TIM-barrel domain-containing protein [uncultured Draconibacterium sp.]|uniref:TIM-barrel domain-containing protein n=1 Tax=uncultured Draconibacterium sp. TaxID=1573823 RepID=UPI0025F96ACD|nr:TIM-barrel domain-containing protein [uncultured Draconibacterium sp.]